MEMMRTISVARLNEQLLLMLLLLNTKNVTLVVLMISSTFGLPINIVVHDDVFAACGVHPPNLF